MDVPRDPCEKLCDDLAVRPLHLLVGLLLLFGATFRKAKPRQLRPVLCPLEQATRLAQLHIQRIDRVTALESDQRSEDRPACPEVSNVGFTAPEHGPEVLGCCRADGGQQNGTLLIDGEAADMPLQITHRCIERRLCIGPRGGCALSISGQPLK